MAGQRLNQDVYVEGLNTLQRLLNPPDELIAEPWKFAMIDLVERGKASGRVGAPYRSGVLRANISSRVQARPFPRWGAIRSRGASRKSKKYPRGFPYPRFLNYAARWGRVGWFDRAVIVPVMAQADGVLAAAANKIATKWGRY